MLFTNPQHPLKFPHPKIDILVSKFYDFGGIYDLRSNALGMESLLQLLKQQLLIRLILNFWFAHVNPNIYQMTLKRKSLLPIQQ